MKKTERHTAIVDDLEREPALRVNELAERYEVSTETIRRDFADLTQRGLINRTYGGAVRIISSEPALSERERLQVAERELIARMAVDRIETNDVLMVGGGITTRYFAKALAVRNDSLTVITPSFSVAMALGACRNITVNFLPGQFNGNEGLVEGADTIEALGLYRATKAILGASGLSIDGPSDAAIPAGRIYQKMSERSSQTFILADSSKFEKFALYCYSSWGPNLTLVTDARTPQELHNVIDAADSQLIVPEGTLRQTGPSIRSLGSVNSTRR